MLDVVAALHRLVEAQSSHSEHGYLITSAELLAILHELRDARLAFDTLIELAEPGLADAPPTLQRCFQKTFHPATGATGGEEEFEAAERAIAEAAARHPRGPASD